MGPVKGIYGPAKFGGFEYYIPPNGRIPSNLSAFEARMASSWRNEVADLMPRICQNFGLTFDAFW